MVDTPGKITLWQVEIFVAAAEEPSITAAARRLGASPSAVSQQLSNLEAALGARLLTRTERPMPLTQAGELFLHRAQTILHEAAMATSELALKDLSARMRLRIGVIEDFDADVTPALLTGLAEQMPKAQFLLETGASHRLMDQLETRALDMAVTAEPNNLSPSYEVHPLMEDPFVVVTPRRMVREGADLMATLRAHPLILYTSRHVMGRQIASHLSRVKLRASHRFELDSYHAIMAMVAKGEGWTILTPLGVMRAKRFIDRVDIFELPFEPISRRISLMAREGATQDMPSQVAAEMRPLFQRDIVEYCTHKMPWLKGQMRVLE
ncbi:LysR family transcriptional regulator [uncultured Litoreibacter sp.]|uniref:LysR family transcriptional regulator n=1 Tax=uncultured Litoreibacter sp. TaxID=1392394 RepID=UPI0026193385|nr:LysR family transcriptional regulator [uncultured Litoreibacter sp.]